MSIALYCLLIAGLLPVFTVVLAKQGVRLDNHSPRNSAESLTGYRKRAYAAHQNGFETFPLFAAAVLAAEMQGAPQGWLNALAALFVVLRLIYTGFYLADLATFRSIAWMIGWLVTIAIFLLPLLK